MARLNTQHIAVILEVAIERWWRDTIAALPLPLQTYFGLQRWLIIEDGAGEAVLSTEHTRPVAIALAPSEVLFFCIELPLLSRFQLPALMRFEATRHIPLPLNQARIDYRIVERDVAASRMVVELAITRAEAVQAAEVHVKMARLTPEAILLQSSRGKWLSRRLLVRQWQEVFTNRRYRLLFVRMAIPTAVICFCVLAAQNLASRLAENRADLVTAAESQAADIGPLRSQLASLNNQISFLASARNRASAAAITEEVARLLPDDAWLQELDIEPQNIRLVGTSRHATDLLQIFSGSKLFSNVQFEAPLIPAQMSGGDQFDLVMARN